eukprot:TRINITY_DN22698_c0_g1_i1.p1 TRINITY_DN22698_c0_g1~~TRINITY_DN22698_c0_g1_i1.p1  ORF type:complete len:312 (-),score=24.92 TRINITY_DN22698_c0_g1_i1:177-1112(-)
MIRPRCAGFVTWLALLGLRAVTGLRSAGTASNEQASLGEALEDTDIGLAVNYSANESGDYPALATEQGCVCGGKCGQGSFGGGRPWCRTQKLPGGGACGINGVGGAWDYCDKHSVTNRRLELTCLCVNRTDWGKVRGRYYSVVENYEYKKNRNGNFKGRSLNECLALCPRVCCEAGYASGQSFDGIERCWFTFVAEAGGQALPTSELGVAQPGEGTMYKRDVAWTTDPDVECGRNTGCTGGGVGVRENYYFTCGNPPKAYRHKGWLALDILGTIASFIPVPSLPSIRLGTPNPQPLGLGGMGGMAMAMGGW